MIENVIFDLDGVIRGIKNTPILDVLPGDLKIKYKAQYQNNGIYDFAHGYLPLPIFRDWDKGLVSAQDVVSEIAKQGNEPLEVAEDVFYCALKPEYNFVYSQTVEYIQKLKKQGYHIYILSNLGQEVVNMLPQILDLNLFDGALFSCESGMRKPDSEIYIKALEKFNISAENSIFIDDNMTNLPPFEKLGGKTHLFDKFNISQTLDSLDKIIQA